MTTAKTYATNGLTSITTFIITTEHATTIISTSIDVTTLTILTLVDTSSVIVVSGNKNVADDVVSTPTTLESYQTFTTIKRILIPKKLMPLQNLPLVLLKATPLNTAVTKMVEWLIYLVHLVIKTNLLWLF